MNGNMLLDPVFYAVAAGFLAALFFLVYAIKRYVELKNESGFEEDEEPLVEMPGPNVTARTMAHLIISNAEKPVPDEESCAEGPAPCACAQAQGPCPDASASRAETFVKGIYDGISGLDARLGNIESSLSKSRVNGEFAVKFLEDLLADLGSLDKEKIKGRIEFLLSDLKK